MDNYIEHVDTSFDLKLGQGAMFTWLPWIGKNYSSSKVKTLILGESTYNWETLSHKRENVDKRIGKDNHLRVVHNNNAMDFKRKSPYVRNIERALCLKKNPKHTEINQFWRNVAYHNLVLRPMPTLKHRPKYKDYVEGWFAFIELAKLIEVEQCVVYGVEAKKLKSIKEVLVSQDITHSKIKKIKPALSRSYARKMDIQLNNRNIEILFIRHPSSYFSWKKWGATINRELNIEAVMCGVGT